MRSPRGSSWKLKIKDMAKLFLLAGIGAVVLLQTGCTTPAPDPNRAKIIHRDGSVSYVGPSRMDKQDQLMRDHRDALNRAFYAF